MFVIIQFEYCYPLTYVQELRRPGTIEHSNYVSCIYGV
jgi:hypothetical protein